MAARMPARPSAPEEASDPTLATSIDATNGITVIRIRLMKIVPTGATTATSVATAGDEEPASARPTTKPATRPINTRVVRDTRESYRGLRRRTWQEVCIKPPAGGINDPDPRLRLPVALGPGARDQLYAG